MKTYFPPPKEKVIVEEKEPVYPLPTISEKKYDAFSFPEKKENDKLFKCLAGTAIGTLLLAGTVMASPQISPEFYYESTTYCNSYSDQKLVGINRMAREDEGIHAMEHAIKKLPYPVSYRLKKQNTPRFFSDIYLELYDKNGCLINKIGLEYFTEGEFSIRLFFNTIQINSSYKTNPDMIEKITYDAIMNSIDKKFNLSIYNVF